MCFVCWSIAGASLTAAAIDRKCNHSRITNKVKSKFNNLKEKYYVKNFVPNTPFVLHRDRMPDVQTRET